MGTGQHFFQNNQGLSIWLVSQRLKPWCILVWKFLNLGSH
jgi:hypothetical protein